MDNGMTYSDFAAFEKMGNRHRGVANTALGLGIAGLAVGLVGVWGMNKVSEARSRAAENISAAYATRQNDILSLIASERLSRENWQAANQPTISQSLTLQNNPSLQSTVQDIVSAMATAQATANNTGINSAVAHEDALRVHLYGAPQPCNCPGSCGGY